MVKKIIVFMLLFTLLVGVGVTEQVKAANSTETTADDVKYADVEDFMHSIGYTTFVIEDGYSYFVFLDDVDLCVFRVSCDVQEGIRCFWNTDTSLNADGEALSIVSYNYMLGYFDLYETPSSASVSGNISPVRNGTIDKKSVTLDGIAANTLNWTGWSFDTLIYSDYDIYLIDSYPDYYSNVSEVVFEGSMAYVYNFQLWCSDAGLNCLASSNESPTKIPYSYNSYWHIVRKSSSGNWLLTTIGSTLGQAKMNLRLSDSGDLIIYEYSGEDSFTISVRQYVYDTDGWLVHTYDTYDYDDFSSGLLTLPAGSGLDDTRVLAYTSTDIYSSDGLSVYAAASTEYVEPSAPDVTPEPTTAPDSGSDDTGSDDSGDSDDSGSSGGGTGGGTSGPGIVVGGQAKPGGLMELVLYFIRWVWTDLFAVQVPVDGYDISVQEVIIYSLLVSLLGAALGYSIFGGKKVG